MKPGLTAPVTWIPPLAGLAASVITGAVWRMLALPRPMSAKMGVFFFVAVGTGSVMSGRLRAKPIASTAYILAWTAIAVALGWI